MVVSQANLRDYFESHFMKWAIAVIKYSKETQVHSSSIQHILQDYSEDADAGKLLGHCVASVFIYNYIQFHHVY